jgi:hypothetical protein
MPRLDARVLPITAWTHNERVLLRLILALHNQLRVRFQLAPLTMADLQQLLAQIQETRG